MIIDCISDLHGHYPELPGGDLLIVAGDLTARDTYQENILFKHWLDNQNYKKKVFIAGNHDNLIQNTDLMDDVFYEYFDSYLCDSGTEFEGLKIWGSPWTKTFPGMNPHCKAFTVDTEEELAEKWAMIPDDVDILVTHSPPHGCYLDQDKNGNMLGCVSLRDRLFKLKVKLHVFGHIHEGYGVHPIVNPDSINASHVNERYEPVNKPIRIEL